MGLSTKGPITPYRHSWAHQEEAAKACRANGTKQCAPICLSHSCLIDLGKCPSLLEVWTTEALAKRQYKPQSLLDQLDFQAEYKTKTRD